MKPNYNFSRKKYSFDIFVQKNKKKQLFLQKNFFVKKKQEICFS